MVDLWRRLWRAEPTAIFGVATLAAVSSNMQYADGERMLTIRLRYAGRFTEFLICFAMRQGGSEGNGQHMGGMRWSQTANYGVLPNPRMPHSFLAQVRT
jgi:hypothetical protein